MNENAPTAQDATHALLGGLIDYAGLFPPSKVAMDTAVSNFAAYRHHAASWMLARFVVPVSRLDEFERAAAEHLPDHPALHADGDDEEAGDPHDVAWRLSALIAGDGDLDEQIERIFAFNAAHEEDEELGAAVIDAIELKPNDADDVDECMEMIPEQLTPFFELDHRRDIRGHLAALAGTGGNAKIRCGGVTPEAFPSAEEVARFIHGCAMADVRFKFTAGLHHPVRAEQNLTYEPTPPRGVMHGFLNVFAAAALARRRRFDVERLVPVIEERDPGAFVFRGGELSVAGETLTAEELAGVRSGFAISVGSCSFTEPVDDLVAIGVLA